MDAEQLVASMSLTEQLHEIRGRLDPLRGALPYMTEFNRKPTHAGGSAAHGVEPLAFSDGPRGVSMGHSTCYPVAIARGASFDVSLEQQIASAIGVECRAQGANFWAGICINVVRHPRWGRTQESYGEAPAALGLMGAAAIAGARDHVMTCVKHFACNSIEDSRFRVSVEADRRTLHEVYFGHFRHCVEHGASAVMSAYNRINGSYCSHDRWLLTETLRERWGFEGLVMSDFVFGVYDGALALAAGLDIEMPFRWRFGRELEQKLARGAVDPALVRRAATHVVRTKLRFQEQQLNNTRVYDKSVVACDAHERLALQSARHAMVLLKNEANPRHPLLPLDRTQLRSLAVVGPLADEENLGDRGSSRVRPPRVITFAEGLCRLAGSVRVRVRASRDSRAIALAQASDVAVVVVGMDASDEGENMVLWGGDRRSLGLAQRDVEFVQKLAAVQRNLVLVLVGGSVVSIANLQALCPSIIMAWYPGMSGGQALAELLFGLQSPSGRLPIAWAHEQELAPFDSRAKRLSYERLHGQRWMDHAHRTAEYRFGHGLSYARINRSVTAVRCTDKELIATIKWENNSDRAAQDVALLYGAPASAGAHDLPAKLLGFARQSLAPGQTLYDELRAPLWALARFDVRRDLSVIDPSAFRFFLHDGSQEVTHTMSEWSQR
jgi:beta-glucosidase